MRHPSTDRPIGYGDPALSHQVLDVPEAEREAQIQPNGMLDDGWWEPIPAVTQCLHRRTLPAVRSQDHRSSPNVTNPSGRVVGSNERDMDVQQIMVELTVQP